MTVDTDPYNRDPLKRPSEKPLPPMLEPGLIAKDLFAQDEDQHETKPSSEPREKLSGGVVSPEERSAHAHDKMHADLDIVDEASSESFPASDSPSYTPIIGPR